MEHNLLLQRQCAMLGSLAGLPRRMLSLHGVENVTEFVLHDLCQENCFNLNKIAYFVDNPDFNCTKGVAGFSRDEELKSCDILWNQPKQFSDQMRLSPFNQRVRGLSQCSLKSLSDSHDEVAKNLAQELGFKNYAHCSWGMKHDNHGFVLYEKANLQDIHIDDHILNGLSLLSFCPIF